MNIFYLSNNPQVASKEHIDKHVVKMILESAQLLCTSHRILDGTEYTETKINKANKKRTVKRYRLSDSNLESILYSATHINHPCAIWSRDSINNYMWLYNMFICLCDEYTYRYKKVHKCDSMFRDLLKTAPKSISNKSISTPAQAMPDQYKDQNPVVAYRKYYIAEKAKFAKWTNRDVPSWFSNGDVYANL